MYAGQGVQIGGADVNNRNGINADNIDVGPREPLNQNVNNVEF